MLLPCICGKTLKLPDATTGRRFQCPACGHIIVRQDMVAPPRAATPPPSLTANSASMTSDSAVPSSVFSETTELEPSVAVAFTPSPAGPWLRRIGHGLWAVAALNVLIAGGLVVRAMQVPAPLPGPPGTPTPKPVVKVPEISAKPAPPPKPVEPVRVRQPSEAGVATPLKTPPLRIFPSGKEVLSVEGAALAIWSRETGKIRRTPGDGRPVHALAIMPDDRHGLICRGEGPVELIDLTNWQTIRTFASAGRAPLLIPSGDGTRAFGVDALGRHVVAWNIADGSERVRSPQLPAPAEQLAASRAGAAVLIRAAGRAHVWRQADPRELKALSFRSGPIGDIAIAADGETAMLVGEKRLHRWDLVNDREVMWFEPPAPPTRIALSDDARWALAATADTQIDKPMPFRYRVYLLDLERVCFAHTFDGPSMSARYLAFASDGIHGVWYGQEGMLTLATLPFGTAAR